LPVSTLELILLLAQTYPAYSPQNTTFDWDGIFDNLPKLADEPSTIVNVTHISFEMYAVDSIVLF
jgi:hypothetical protein